MFGRIYEGSTVRRKDMLRMPLSMFELTPYVNSASFLFMSDQDIISVSQIASPGAVAVEVGFRLSCAPGMLLQPPLMQS